MSTKTIDAIDNAVEWLVSTGAPPKLITDLQDIVRRMEWENRYGNTPREEA